MPLDWKYVSRAKFVAHRKSIKMKLDAISSLSFLDNDPRYQHEKPYEIIAGMAPSGWKSNCKFTTVPGLLIRDCRNFRDQLTIDTCGFEYHDWDCTSNLQYDIFESADGGDLSTLIEPYLLETIARVRERFHAEKVVCFDWRVRLPPGYPPSHLMEC